MGENAVNIGQNYFHNVDLSEANRDKRKEFPMNPNLGRLNREKQTEFQINLNQKFVQEFGSMNNLQNAKKFWSKLFS